MFRPTSILTMVACLFVLVAGDAGAQGLGGTNTGSSSSLFGGGSLGGASSFGSSQFGSGFGQSSLGQGGFGQSNFGTGLGNNAAFGGQSGFGQNGFVGRDAADVTGMFNNMTRQTQQFTDVISRIERSINRGNQNEGEQARSKVRVRLKVAFDNPVAKPQARAAAFDARMRKIMVERKISNVTLSRQDGIVTITGTAASEFDRKVMEKLVKFDPAVKSVSNQMTVSEAIAAPTPQE